MKSPCFLPLEVLMTVQHKPVESKQTLKLRVKSIKEEIKEADIIIKQYERSAQLQCTTEETSAADDSNSPKHIVNDPDMQMLLWDLEDNEVLANMLKEELKTNISEKQQHKEDLKNELEDLYSKLRFYSPVNRFLHDVCTDFIACLNNLGGLSGYALGTTIIWLIFTSCVAWQVSGLGSLALSQCVSAILSALILLTTFDIADKSKRPKGVRLTVVSAFFPMVFRVMPGMMATFFISSAVVPQAIIDNTVENYLKGSASPVADHWKTNFYQLDQNGDDLITSDELAALCDSLEVKTPAPIHTLKTPEGKRAVDQMNSLDVTSTANMLQHLHLHWTRIGHPIVYKRGSDLFGTFTPQEYGISREDLAFYPLHR